MRLHADGGVEYGFPDLLGPEFIAVHVVVDANDVPVQCVAARKTVEAFLLVDKTWKSPFLRWRWFVELHEKVRALLAKDGYTDIHCWLAPHLEKSFGRRLEKLGWKPSTWKVFACFTETK